MIILKQVLPDGHYGKASEYKCSLPVPPQFCNVVVVSWKWVEDKQISRDILVRRQMSHCTGRVLQH